MAAPNFGPLVSIIVPVRNGALDLPDLLQCIGKQNYPADNFELFIVVNNSTDRTEAVGRKLASTCPFKVEVICDSRYESSYSARNIGIKHARGEIIAFTDVDCRPSSAWLKSLVDGFGIQNVGIVAGAVKSLAGDSIIERWSMRRDLLSQQHTLSNEHLPFAQTANMAIRRDVLVEIGLFRPAMPGGGDADLCWRMQHTSAWNISYCPNAIVMHRHRSSVLALYEQFHRYGTSFKRLHLLHDSPLRTGFGAKKTVYELTRFLFRHGPRNIFLALFDRAHEDELFAIPLDLLIDVAFQRGQSNARLQAHMKIIETMDSLVDSVVSS